MPFADSTTSVILAGSRRSRAGSDSSANPFGTRSFRESANVGTKKTGKGRRKVGSKKRRMRAKIRHRK
jgi:hypothetical protein